MLMTPFGRIMFTGTSTLLYIFIVINLLMHLCVSLAEILQKHKSGALNLNP